MPTYQYRCRNCGHEFDIKQRMSDDPLTDCPVCEGGIRRVVGSVSVVFKGSGFYVTDNRSGSNGSSNAAKTKDKESPESKSEDKTSGKSETKPTSKTESKKTGKSNKAE